MRVFLLVLFYCFHTHIRVNCLRNWRIVSQVPQKQRDSHLPAVASSADVPPYALQDAETFRALRNTEDRCINLLKKGPSYLLSFYSPALKCFKLYPGAESDHVRYSSPLQTHFGYNFFIILSTYCSITSTCMVLNAMLADPENWKQDAKWEGDVGQISVRDIVSTLKSSRWSYDSFQLPILISTLIKLRSVDVSDPAYIKGVETLLEQRSRISLHRSQIHSAYLRLQNARALLAVVENDVVPAKVREGGTVGKALERATLVAFDEMCRQLAFYNSGDLSNFDPTVLAFTTMTYYETSQSLFLKSFARGVVPAMEMKLIKSALRIIFAVQREDGTWLKGEPISKQGSSRIDTDIGNNYVFFFDLVCCLLGPMAERDPSLLAPYVTQLEKYVF